MDNDLYQDILLDHYRKPRNFRPLSDEEVLVDDENPLCGDRIRMTATVKDGKVADVTFDGRGCAISVASASLMTERLVGRTVADARRLIADFVALLRGEKEMSEDELGDLVALEGVRQFPLRVKCATMAWHAAEKILAGKT